MTSASRGTALAAAARMTDRDRQVLLLLAHHQVLTTHQITRVFFDNPRVARRRVQVLREVDLIDCFRPAQLVGSAPQHCVLTTLGGAAVAGLIQEPHVVPIRQGAAEQLAVRPDLKHLVGVNDVFCSLAGAARDAHDAELELWWSERACTRTWGTFVRPDGFGRWREGSQSIDFFLEYDTGTEHSPQILAKLPGYGAVAAATQITTPVLFWLHSPRREQALHRRLSAAQPPVPVATASGDPKELDPSGQLWRPVGRSDSERLRLIELSGLDRGDA